MKTLIATLLVVLSAPVIIASTMEVEIVADSVRDFSGTQGLNGWSYGYWNRSADADERYDGATDFHLLQHFGADSINRLSSHSDFTTGKLWYLEDGRYYTSVWAEGGHPHGTMDLGTYARSEQWVIRRWVSTVDGQVEIRGHAGKVMPWGENWSGTVKFQVVAGDDRVYAAEVSDGGSQYVVSVPVQVGTPVDFLIGPGSAIGVVKFTASISAVGRLSN